MSLPDAGGVPSLARTSDTFVARPTRRLTPHPKRIRRRPRPSFSRSSDWNGLSGRWPSFVPAPDREDRGQAPWCDRSGSSGVSNVDPRLNFPPEKLRLTEGRRPAQSKSTSGDFPLTLQPIRAMLTLELPSTKRVTDIRLRRFPLLRAPGEMLVLGDFLSPVRSSGGGIFTQARARLTHPPFNVKGGHP